MADLIQKGSPGVEASTDLIIGAWEQEVEVSRFRAWDSFF